MDESHSICLLRYKEVPNMLKMAYFQAYWAIFCIKVALVTEKTLPTLIQTYDTTKKTQKTQLPLVA